MEPVFDPYEPRVIPPTVVAASLNAEPTHVWAGGDVVREVYEADVPLAVGAVPNVALAPVVDDGRPLWPFIAAAVVLALLLGGIGGFLIGNSRTSGSATTVATAPPVVTVANPATTAAATTTTTATAVATATVATLAGEASPAVEAAAVNKTLDNLLAQTQTDGAFPAPSQYPQLDKIIAIQTAKDTAALQAQVAALTAAQTQATDQATSIQTELAAAQASLADAQKQRDDLTAQLAQSSASAADLQKQITARDQQIATLQTDAATAKAALDAANAALTKANSDLDAAKSQLATANATLAKLNPKVLPNFVNSDVAKARSQASANGWTIIEKTTDSTTVAPGTVTAQTPAAGTTMVTGSVLYVEVASKPGG